MALAAELALRCDAMMIPDGASLPPLLSLLQTSAPLILHCLMTMVGGAILLSITLIWQSLPSFKLLNTGLELCLLSLEGNNISID